MKHHGLPLILLCAGIASCAVNDQRGTLAELRKVRMEVSEEFIEGGLEKAMASYQRFLEETPQSAMTPEAIRRLADLKVEREYGVIAGQASAGDAQSRLERPEQLSRPAMAAVDSTQHAVQGATTEAGMESEQEFEARAAGGIEIAAADMDPSLIDEGEDDLMRAGAVEAIALYQKLLDEYPLYERNDQVLYQMSRSYEELGQIEQAMQVMNRMVSEYPNSRYLDEVQFRRGEYYFTRQRFLDAEEAYQAIVMTGELSRYYELGLYKLGWTFYKQELYEEALHNFIAGLDYRVSIGYDFEQTEDKNARQRLDDTYRVISLSFSNLGGPEAVTDYFARHGSRQYESDVYSHLGEFYLQTRRYSDAAKSYEAFVDLHPFHKLSPHFNMRVIDIYLEGGFPRLVVEAKKSFAQTYGLKADYWRYFEVDKHEEVVGYLKKNLMDLANHYHALYQDARFVESKDENFHEALTWYREFLASFPKDDQSPGTNYQLADLLLENQYFGDAAIEYERTAYEYGAHERASEAGYAAVYSHREHLKQAVPARAMEVKQAIVRSSLTFADTFPAHDKADVVLGAAADDLYEMQDFELAKSTARKLVDNYPAAEAEVRRSAWIVLAHASFEMSEYLDAELAYGEVLALTDQGHESRAAFVDNLAASIYKQGELAGKNEEFRTAADHFLRIAAVAPASKIRATAEYDAVAALIQIQEWDEAALVLTGFRNNHPGHELQAEVTKKMAFVYKEAGKLELAATEFERIERESDDPEIRRDALLTAGELYEQAEKLERALDIYLRYLGHFPRPLELALETRFKVANMYAAVGDDSSYRRQLQEIVEIDAKAGVERSDRTRYLAASSALVLAEPLYHQFAGVKLVMPFEKNLKLKQDLMRKALDAFTNLVGYEVGEVTAAATFYMAEMYYGFSRGLMESERPTDLSPLEMEQYELALEDQAYPFEERALSVHEKNLELMTIGIYNKWIDKSLSKLAELIPVRYAKTEFGTGYIETLGSFTFVPYPERQQQEELPVAEDGSAVGNQLRGEETERDMREAGTSLMELDQAA